MKVMRGVDDAFAVTLVGFHFLNPFAHEDADFFQ